MIKKAAIAGAGVIGAGWAARLAYNGVNVAVYDPAKNAEKDAVEVLANANIAMEQLINAPPPPRGEVLFYNNIKDAVRDAQWIIESAPEDMATKRKAYAAIESAAPPDALLSSSTSGILPSQLQENMHHPRRFVVMHPFNPVYLLPLVEVIGGKQTAPQTTKRAAKYCRFLGMHPMVIEKEVPAFVADRLLESLWREALWLVKDGIATTAQIDDAVRMGFGLRWAQMGVFETYRAGGGKGGMRHFLRQFAPALQWPWSKLTNVPKMDESFIGKLAEQSDVQSGMMTAAQLARLRDGNLTAILRALRAKESGAGKILADYETQLHLRAPKVRTFDNKPVRTFSQLIPQEWTDHNGHVNESRYLQCFSEASDELMRLIGADMAYIKGGKSYFTAETHICHLSEVCAGQRVFADTQVLAAGKKLHLFHRLFLHDKNPTLLATGEHLLLHVNMQTRRVCEPDKNILKKATALAKAHSQLPPPQQLGRAITITPGG
ncbi:MAG: carnitine 3-dehydrogenase [Gammaproteobacteria bacterium]